MANQVTLMGRLGADPEVRRVGSDNTPVANVSVATRGPQKPDWHDVTLWDKQAELIGRCKKGEMVYIEGWLKSDEYTDKEGQKRTKRYVRAYRFEFCGSPQQQPQQQGGAQGAGGNPYGDDDLNF